MKTQNLYVVDPATHEATGEIYRFCTDECREKFLDGAYFEAIKHHGNFDAEDDCDCEGICTDEVCITCLFPLDKVTLRSAVEQAKAWRLTLDKHEDTWNSFEEFDCHRDFDEIEGMVIYPYAHLRTAP